jgi:uncharacterized protein (DUF1501 family)
MSNRREVLSLLASSSACIAMPTLAFGGVPENSSMSDRRLVFIFLRGGMDALSAVPPYADPAYAPKRGTLAVPAPGAINGALDLDGKFGLSPFLPEMHRLYADKQLAVLHAVASPYRERSHFDAQNLIENGTSKPFGRDIGWLNVALGIVERESKETSGVNLGFALGQSIPLILRGPSKVGSWSPSKLMQPDSDMLERLAKLYQNDLLLSQSFAVARQTQAMMGTRKNDASDLKGNSTQPILELAKAAGEVLSKPKSARVANIDFGGWDTHISQLGEYAQLTRNLRLLDQSITTLKIALGPVWERTAVLVVSEFGRAVAPNGSGGTDHGTGGVALVVGGAVNGGRVITEWPGLNDQALFEGRDLRPTMDLRAVFKSALTSQLGLSSGVVESEVFPNSRLVRAVPELFR